MNRPPTGEGERLPSPRLAALGLLCALWPSTPLVRGQSEPGPAEPALVGWISVLSDQTEDLSSFEAWKKAVIREGMTDEEEALAAWETTVKFGHHDVTPMEFLGLGESGSVDAFRLFNVYGHCEGSTAQTAFLQLVRQLGFEARKFTINRWEAPEVRYGSARHRFDPTLIA